MPERRSTFSKSTELITYEVLLEILKEISRTLRKHRFKARVSAFVPLNFTRSSDPHVTVHNESSAPTNIRIRADRAQIRIAHSGRTVKVLDLADPDSLDKLPEILAEIRDASDIDTEESD